LFGRVEVGARDVDGLLRLRDRRFVGRVEQRLRAVQGGAERVVFEIWVLARRASS